MSSAKHGIVLVALFATGVQLHAQRGAGWPFRHDDVNVSRKSGPQNEVTIAIAPDNPLNVVVASHDYRTLLKHIGAWASLDGGRTFAGGQIEGIGLYGREGDPALAAHRRGTFYLSYIDHSPTGNRVAVARSTDGGFTWPSVGVVHDQPGLGGSEDKPYLAVDDTGGPFDGNVYVAWVRIADNGGRIRLARSTDRGVSFTSALLTPTVSAVTGPVPAIGPDGEVYVAWKGANSIRFARSTDGGVTFTAQSVVASQSLLPSPLPGAAFRVVEHAGHFLQEEQGDEIGRVIAAFLVGEVR